MVKAKQSCGSLLSVSTQVLTAAKFLPTEIARKLL